LHAGSLVAALASWLDVRAQGGRWLLRFEDVDTPRCVPGADRQILAQLQACGLVPDEPPVWQSQRQALYEAALTRLIAAGWAYPCACSRADIERALQRAHLPRPRHGERVYPGTCRNGLHGRPPRAMRMLVAPSTTPPFEPLAIGWTDRRLGAQHQDLSTKVGDFVLRRADGLWAYQLAVVVDDGAQGVTHVVRGADLADNTPRQMHLQRALSLPTPVYLHTPLVLGSDGEKLSKGNGAAAIDTTAALAALRTAGRALGLQEPQGDTVAQWLQAAVAQWAQRWPAAQAPARLA
jgi:glutamyl-Q tRNA(Asp) synthetase